MCAVCSCAEQHRHPSGWHQARLGRLEQDLLAKNNRYAEANCRYLAERGLFALNLVSSPGSGAVSSGGQPGPVHRLDTQAQARQVIKRLTSGDRR